MGKWREGVQVALDAGIVRVYLHVAAHRTSRVVGHVRHPARPIPALSPPIITTRTVAVQKPTGPLWRFHALSLLLHLNCILGHFCDFDLEILDGDPSVPGWRRRPEAAVLASIEALLPKGLVVVSLDLKVILVLVPPPTDFCGESCCSPRRSARARSCLLAYPRPRGQPDCPHVGQWGLCCTRRPRGWMLPAARSSPWEPRRAAQPLRHAHR